MKNILVLNGHSYGNAIAGLGRIVTDVRLFLDYPDKFELILFTGGEDVSPELYGDDSPEGYCYNNPRRDAEEMRVFELALKKEILMTGICRGVQFLNVMSGGRMMHHVDNHAGRNHLMETFISSAPIYVNSLHHQMVVPNEKGIIVGWSVPRLSKTYIGRRDLAEAYEGPEVEAVIFPETRSFGVQYHPEMMDRSSDGYLFYKKMVHAALSNPFEIFVEMYNNKEHADGAASLRHSMRSAT